MLNAISSLVGNTPYVQVQSSVSLSASLHLKLEGCNPTQSIKDRACLQLIKDAIEKGNLREGMTILDASSGNLGCALAYFAKLLRYPATVVCSSKLTQEKRNYMLFFGAEVVQLGDFTIEGNNYCRELSRSERHRYCFLDQLHSWGNPHAHYESTGPEILRAFPSIAMVVASMGSGGTLLGIGQYFKKQAPHVRIAAVQAASGTRLPGTASLDDGDYISPFIAKAYNDGIVDFTFKVTEADAISGTLALRDQGIFVGPQSGGVSVAAQALIQQHEIRGSVVAISGDSGWKNLDKMTSAMRLSK
jgi:[CysO sulfur-carrier protein]-thiocarboxylate-dependent cysteine synthase